MSKRMKLIESGNWKYDPYDEPTTKLNITYKNDEWLLKCNQGPYIWTDINLSMYLRMMYHRQIKNLDKLCTILYINKKHPHLSLKINTEDETVFSILGLDYERCLAFGFIDEIYKEIRSKKINTTTKDLVDMLSYDELYREDERGI